MITERSPRLRVQVLGEFLITVGDRPAIAPRGMHAEILAILALEPGHHVSSAHLIDQLWTPSQPSNAAARLHVHISRIRRLLADLGAPDEVLQTRNDGYVLEVGQDGCDHTQFESLAARGAALQREGDPARAAAVLAEALNLWRGRALGELGDREWAQAAASRLTQLRRQVLDTLADAYLALGRPAEAVAFLEPALEDDPLRERTAELLMVALYRCGRQADALAVFARTRERLAGELGLDPSPPLAAAHLAILRHDRALAAEDQPAGGAGGTAVSLEVGVPPPADGTVAAGAGLVDLPIRRSPFHGREDLLRLVERRLVGTDGIEEAAAGRPDIVVLIGMGGIGKTRLALEVAHRARQRLPIVRWMPAAEPVQIADAFGRLAAALDIREGADQAAMVTRVGQELGRRSGWLLIFDDCPDPAALEPFLPSAGAGTVLITSRHRAWGTVGTTLLVPPLDAAESVGLLTAVTGDADDHAAGDLADQLGGLPLALVQAAAYIDQTGMSLKHYLAMFRRRRIALLSRAVPEDHHGGVATTWEMSFDQVAARSDVAAELLRICASLGPAEITFEMLAAAAAHLDEPLRTAVGDELGLEDATAELLRFSLVTRSGQSIRMHPLVRAVLTQRFGEHEEHKRRIVADRILRAIAPNEPGESRDWMAWSRWVPHALDLAERHETAADHDLAVPLLHAAGRYLGARALYGTARDVLARAVRCGEIAWSVDDPRLVPLYSELGLVLEWLGDLPTSRLLQEGSLRLLETANRAATSEAARVLVRLGRVLACQRDLAPAMAAQRRALKILDPVSAPLEFGRCLTDLGLTQWMSGSLVDARQTFDRAIGVLDAAVGPLDPSAAHARSGQAVVLQDLGELEQALEVQSGVIESMTVLMGPRHPDTAHALDKHAYLLRLVGRRDESAAEHRAATDILREVYGGDHVELAMPLTNLGLAQLEAGDLAAAEAAQRHAKDLFAAAFGLRHPHTALARRRLGVVLSAQGRHEEAVLLLRSALQDTLEAFGQDHPDVAGTRDDLAKSLAAITLPA